MSSERPIGLEFDSKAEAIVTDVRRKVFLNLVENLSYRLKERSELFPNNHSIDSFAELNDVYRDYTEHANTLMPYLARHDKNFRTLKRQKPYLTFVQSTLNSALLIAAQKYFAKNPKSFMNKFGGLFKIDKDNNIVYIIPDKSAMTKPHVIEDLLTRCKSMRSVSDSQKIIIEELSFALHEIMQNELSVEYYEPPFILNTPKFKFTDEFISFLESTEHYQNEYTHPKIDIQSLDNFESNVTQKIDKLKVIFSKGIKQIYANAEIELEQIAKRIREVNLESLNNVTKEQANFVRNSYKEFINYFLRFEELSSESPLPADKEHLLKITGLKEELENLVIQVFFRRSISKIHKLEEVIHTRLQELSPLVIDENKFQENLKENDYHALNKQYEEITSSINALKAKAELITVLRDKIETLIGGNIDNRSIKEIILPLDQKIEEANINLLFEQLNTQLECNKQATILVALSLSQKELQILILNEAELFNTKLQELQELHDKVSACLVQFDEARASNILDTEVLKLAFSTTGEIEYLNRELEISINKMEQLKKSYSQLQFVDNGSLSSLFSVKLQQADFEMQETKNIFNKVDQDIIGFRKLERRHSTVNEEVAFFAELSKNRNTKIVNLIKDVITDPANEKFWQSLTKSFNLLNLISKKIQHKATIREVTGYPATILQMYTGLFESAQPLSENDFLTLLKAKIIPLINASLQKPEHEEEIKGNVEGIKPLRQFYLGILALLNNTQPDLPEVPKNREDLIKLGKSYHKIYKKENFEVSNASSYGVNRSQQR